jgi:hypothetical protein
MPTMIPEDNRAEHQAPPLINDALIGVFHTLARQHADVVLLIERVRDEPERRNQLWKEIRRALLSHEHGELREIYPVLRHDERTAMIAENHDHEAREMERMIEQLDGDMRDDEWHVCFGKLAAAVQTHAEEEERWIFPKAQKVLGAERARALEAAFVATQQEIEAAL